VTAFVCVCIVLSCVDRDFTMGRSPFHKVLPKYLRGFIVPEVNSDSKQARVPSP
jgi:hypothetical protein